MNSIVNPVPYPEMWRLRLSDGDHDGWRDVAEDDHKACAARIGVSGPREGGCEVSGSPIEPRPTGRSTGRRNSQALDPDHGENTDVRGISTSHQGVLRPRRGWAVTTVKFPRDESVFAPRASGVKLPSDASISGMVQIHKGERTKLLSYVPPLLHRLALEDALNYGIKDFSPYAADVTAIEFGRPEFARKIPIQPPTTLFFEKHGLVPVPPEDDYVEGWMRLPTVLHTYVTDLGKRTLPKISTPQCVINALAHRLGCAEMLHQNRRGALIAVA